MGFVNALRNLFGTGGSSPIISDPSLDQLHEGYLLDYDLQTWEVTRHTTTEYEGRTIDTWTLRHQTDRLRLEHIVDADHDGFRLSEPVEMSDLTAEGTPLLGIVREGEPPPTVQYQGREYDLAEKYTRTEEKPISFARSETDQWLAGVWGGIAAYLSLNATALRLGFLLSTLYVGWYELSWYYRWTFLLAVLGAYLLVAMLLPTQSHSSTETGDRQVFHDWVYRDGDEALTLEYDSTNWSAYVGRTVEPHEFDNILPRGSS